LLEKVYTERHYWAKVYHMAHFTGGIDVCSRNELIKAHLLVHFMRRDTSLEDAAKAISRSDCLQPAELANPGQEFRKVRLGKLEDLPLFEKYLPANLSLYACLRV